MTKRKPIKEGYFDRHLVGWICLGKVFSDETDPFTDERVIGYLMRKGPKFKLLFSSVGPLTLKRAKVAFNVTETAFREVFGGSYIKKDILGKWRLVNK